MSCFFAAAFICTFSSSVFHTLTCHSAAVDLASQVLDYIGIAVLIVGSVAAVTYYGLFCHT